MQNNLCHTGQPFFNPRSEKSGLETPEPPIDPQKAKEFVFGAKARGATETAAASATTPTIPRSPLSTRIRADYSKALKRASLDRQLKGVEPSTLCDILEQAIEPWLKANGYLP